VTAQTAPGFYHNEPAIRRMAVQCQGDQPACQTAADDDDVVARALRQGLIVG
jgi:hypothetical protein